MHRILTFLMAIAFIVTIGTAANAAYNGAWLNNDGNANFASFDVSEYNLFLYDYGDESTGIEIFSAGSTGGSTVYFGLVDDLWYATLLAPFTSDTDASLFDLGVDTVLLGDDSFFGLYFTDDSGNLIEYDYSVFATNSMYYLEPGQSSSLMVVDAYPSLGPHETPLPAAIWLLGSGLMGITAARKKIFV